LISTNKFLSPLLFVLTTITTFLKNNIKEELWKKNS